MCNDLVLEGVLKWVFFAFASKMLFILVCNNVHYNYGHKISFASIISL
jgi:hypothetical protein